MGLETEIHGGRDREAKRDKGGLVVGMVTGTRRKTEMGGGVGRAEEAGEEKIRRT